MTSESRSVGRWTPDGIRLFAALLVAFQLVQGLFDPIRAGNRTFTQSYYLVTYEPRLHPTGLLGERLHLVVGPPHEMDVDGAPTSWWR